MNSSNIEKVIQKAKVTDDILSLAKDLESLYTDNHLTQNELLELALLCRGIGKRELAYKYVQKAIAIGEVSERLKFEAGLSCHDMSRYSDAKKWFMELTTEYPGNSDYWYWLANTCIFTSYDDYGKIIKYFQNSLDINCTNTHAVECLLRYCINNFENSELIDKCSHSYKNESNAVIFHIYNYLAGHLNDKCSPDSYYNEVLCHYKEDKESLAIIQNCTRRLYIDSEIKNNVIGILCLDIFYKTSAYISKLIDITSIPQHIEASLNGIINFINQHYSSKTLIVVHTSGQYFPAFQQWYRLFSAHKIDDKLLIIALDNKALELIDKHYPHLIDKVYLLSVFPDIKAIYGNGQNGAFYWNIKVHALKAIIESGHNVIQTDVDAFWKKDISLIFEYEFDYMDADIVSQKEGGLPKAIAISRGFVLCAGFWGLRSNQNTKIFLEHLIEYTSFLWDDQTALNKLIFDSASEWTSMNDRYTCYANFKEAENIKIVALPEALATRLIWDFDKAEVAIVHGQYFKHEDWVNQRIDSFLDTGLKDKIDNDRTYFLLGKKSFNQSNHDDALLYFNKISNEASVKKEVLLLSSSSLRALHRFEESIAKLNELLILEPQHIHGLMWKGLSLKDVGEYEQALSCFLTAKQLDSSHVNAYIQSAGVLRKLHDSERSIEILHELLVFDPNNKDAQRMLIETLFAKGIALKQSDNLVESLKTFDELLTIDCQHVHALMWRGLVLEGLGDVNLSLQSIFKAIEYDPSHINGYFQGARIAKNSRKIELARDVLHKLLAVDSFNRDAITMLDELKEY